MELSSRPYRAAEEEIGRRRREERGGEVDLVAAKTFFLL